VKSAGGDASIVFNVKARALPTVTNVNPKYYRQATTPGGIIVTGTDLELTQSVNVGAGVTVTSYNADSDDQLTIDLSVDDAAVIGNRNLVVTTRSGDSAPYVVAVAAKAPPVLLNINPTSVVQGWTAVKLTVNGRRLLNPSNVIISGTGLPNQTFDDVSDEKIEVNFDVDEAAPPGNRAITVTTPGGSANITLAVIKRMPPFLKSVAPNVIFAGMPCQITIDANNVSNFKGLGIAGTGHTYVLDHLDENTVVATVNFDVTAAKGIRQLVLFNHGGQSNPLTIKVM
jgi:hypothetical protein